MSHSAAVRIERYSSIDEVPLAIWEPFASRSAVGLEAGHLRAVEVSRINDLRPYYLIGYAAGEPVGIASCFAIDLDLSPLVTDDPPEVVAAVKAWNRGFMELRVVEVGHVASLGTAVEARPRFQAAFLRALAAEVDEIGRLEGADLGVVRDVGAARYEDFRVLEEDGYRPTMGFPIARLELAWTSFGGYLAALKHKKRADVLRKRAALDAPGIAVEVIEDYGPHAERLAELWGQVARRHGEYEHERLTPAYFAAMARHLRGRSHVVAITLRGTIVAFGLALIGDDEYFGSAEGMDYGVRDAYELYSNLFFETIRVACELGKQTVNLGITTYDFKAALGAELHPCVYFVKAFGRPELSAAWADLFRTKLVVTDSLFSMEGTVVDLPAIVRLVERHGARLMLDESHAIGVMGPTGRGVAEHYGLLDRIDLVMGTLSKSLASIGGFVAGDRKIIDTLRHTARSHIFSASLPPASVAAALEALELVDQEPERRRRLLANARFLAHGLRELGYRVGHHGGGIVPLFCGSELLAIAAFHRLLQDGVFVNPVTYPAVPRGQELLRLSVMATHDEAMLRRALEVFARARTPAWPAAA
ncbi:MAG TPA: aminotransferase class I/II-fold pyridoxal phosphate-dependent enzyme [Anaeromyxobacteraceae bacterium]|nr:aminotransferase class I/II-fold pyridoxal phosphate-dependent enzyme [Anaeromyxobacteraceae bacterium]